ncbi:hypothetical protein IIC68_02910 [archaeon]|nr:hypothetical protein [archaeon]
MVLSFTYRSFLTRSIISLLGLAPDSAFEINLLRDSFTVQTYDISVTRDGFNLASDNFEVIDSTTTNVIVETNDRTIDWVLDPVFLKLMHYERINQLSFVWWQLFRES